jgi:hypothetical protein
MAVLERIRRSRIAAPSARMRRRRSPPRWAPLIVAGGLLAAISVVAVLMKRGGRQRDRVAGADDGVVGVEGWGASATPAFS